MANLFKSLFDASISILSFFFRPVFRISKKVHESRLDRDHRRSFIDKFNGRNKKGFRLNDEL